MSLYVFSTAVLSIIFLVVFNTWWVEGAPFKVHLSALIIAATAVLSTLLLMAIYPIISNRNYAQRRQPNLDKSSWAEAVSSNLSSPAAVIDGYNVRFANKAFLAEVGMLGLKEQILGMPLTNIVHPGDHQHLAMLFASANPNQQKYDNMRIRILCLDGSILPAHISLSPLQEDSSADLYLLQFSSSASLKNTETGHVAQVDHHQLLNQLEQIVFYLKVNQHIMFVNTSWQTMLDYSVADSINKPLLSFVHPEDKPLAEARINSLIQGKRSKALVELRLIDRNGESHWVELRAQNTTAYKGERSSVVGTLTDISQMKLTEASLRTNRHHLITLINNAPGMLYRCKYDKNWSFEFVSDGSVEVTGYAPYEMINDANFSYLHMIHPEDRAKAWESLESKVLLQQRFQLIYRIVTRSGVTKWVLEQGKGVFSSTGELLALEGFITDIADDEPSTLLKFKPFI
jgi:PAS domain S-box-containing protein